MPGSRVYVALQWHQLLEEPKCARDEVVKGKHSSSGLAPARYCRAKPLAASGALWVCFFKPPGCGCVGMKPKCSRSWFVLPSFHEYSSRMGWISTVLGGSEEGKKMLSSLIIPKGSPGTQKPRRRDWGTDHEGPFGDHRTTRFSRCTGCG